MLKPVRGQVLKFITHRVSTNHYIELSTNIGIKIGGNSQFSLGWGTEDPKPQRQQ